MNFELAPEEYWKKLTLSDSQLYCFALNIDGNVGWRLPTKDEYYNEWKIPMLCWNQSSNMGPGMSRETVPVRAVD